MGYWVVVVDDDVMALKNAKMLLTGQDLRISCLRSGSDLLKFMETNSPDLVLLDIVMPEMDGFECYNALRQLEEKNSRSTTPVIFLTGDMDKEHERRGLKYGASDFIRKPFDKEALTSRIINTIENHKTIEKLTRKATIDKLTGFLNKSSGTKKISELCRTAPGALALIDIDNFKLVNDFYGHDMGDRVLIAFSDIMRHSTREDDVLSRIGGDEFLAFFKDVTQDLAVKAVTERLNQQLLERCKELMGEDFDIPIGISVGVSYAPQHSMDFDKLFRNADVSMYRVKLNGKHGVEVYDALESSQLYSRDAGVEEDLARISRLLSERGAAEGVLILGKEAFVPTYQFAIRCLKNYGKDAVRMLFSLQIKGTEGDFSEASSIFQSVLKRCLRGTDMAVQMRPYQYFALLPLTSMEEAEEIRKKIISSWEDEYKGSAVTLGCASEFLHFDRQ